MSKPFLKASWINLLMANFTIDKKILEPYRPAFTELDEWNGDYYASLVGFLFKDTEVRGFRIPYHINFEEVNLRFYVRYKERGEWRRGVVFVKELVPKAAITFIANTLYSENYETRRMDHSFKTNTDTQEIQYRWQVKKEWNHLRATTLLTKSPIQPGSEEEFITEHYWGYTRVNNKKTSAYEVQHPKWNIHPVKSFDYHCNIHVLYGNQFTEPLTQTPTSVFLADGSEIAVMNNYHLT
jgi:uncharacterized protein YqjF (DUF2071 family)